MKKLYKIDSNGYLVFGEDLFITPELDENENEVYNIPGSYTDVEYQGGFFRPRLVDGVWVEARPIEEIEADDLLNALKPTAQEITDAEFELKLIEKLSEWGIL